MTSLSGTFALGTVSADSSGRPVSGYGAFSLQHSGTGANLVWTPLPAIQQWRYTWFNTNANVGSAADDADPNKDGENNLLEFATGQNPNAATRQPGALANNGANLNSPTPVTRPQ